MKALNGYAVLVSDAGVSWARLGSDLVSLISCPPILWSSWNPMTTIKDEKFFFFFGDPWDQVPH